MSNVIAKGISASLNSGEKTTARENLGVEIGVDVQAYDPCIAKSDDLQHWVAQGQIIGTTANSGVTVSGSIITLNLSAFNAFDLGVLAAGAYTLANPTGLEAGVSYKGDIKLTTPASGSVTMTYGSAWSFDDGTDLIIPTDNNAVIFFDFSSYSATKVRLAGAKVWS
jgi:hypothetical protein